MFQQKSLKQFTTFGLGGQGFIAFPKRIDEFLELLSKNPDVFILGGGSNVVFPDGAFAKKIVSTKNLKRIISEEKNKRVEAGCPLAKIFSPAAGVPATVGGGVRNNFGAFGRSIGDYVVEVEVCTKEGKLKTLTKQECNFAYRSSKMKKESLIILNVLLEKFLEKNDFYLQERKSKQPLGLKNAGSIFKNPQNQIAGKLIEEAGCKGMSIGDIYVWEEHANFFINRDNGTCKDLKKLVQDVQDKVFEKFKIKLECEIEFV